MDISVVVPVKNEAANLAFCLESLRAFDEVVVVDSGSTDETEAIAQRFGREVVQFKWDGQFPKKRNWMLRNHTFKHPWVLFLDADERITEVAAQELARVVAHTQHNGFWLGYNNWFLGRQLKYGDPMRKLALVRVGHGEYEQILEQQWSALDMEIHEHMVVEGSVGTIKAKLEHHDKSSISTYYARHNEYSSWEAQRYLNLQHALTLTRRQRLKYRLLTNPFFPSLYFSVSYFLKGGFLDGWAGFYFALGKMFYFYQIQVKIRELLRGSS